MNRDPGDEDDRYIEFPDGKSAAAWLMENHASVYARWKQVHGDTDHDDACGWADGEHDDLGGER